MQRENGELPNDGGSEINSQLLDLQDAFVHAMTVSGTLGKLRAQLRAAAIGLLRGDSALQRSAVGEPICVPELPLASRVALLLVQDFLQSRSLNHTLGIFEAEGSPGLTGGDAKEAIHRLLEDVNPEGSMLERLISATLQSGLASVATASPGLLTTPCPPTPSPETQDMGSVSTSDLLVVAPVVAEALAEYEPSVSFSDSGGRLDEGLYDEIEIL